MLGAHFGALILVHMYVALWAYILVASSSIAVIVILLMQRKTREFSNQWISVKMETRRMEAALEKRRASRK